MDVIILGPLVVFLHVGLYWASSAEVLHPPTLSVLHRHPTYFEGEWVELTCSAPPNRTAEGFRFFNQSGWQILEVPSHPYQQGKLAFKIQMDNTGNYTCDYWMGRGGMEITSAQSNTISLQIKEAPAAPFFSLYPSLDAYNQEDTVSLICSAPPETQKITEFQYFGDRQTTSVVASSPVCMYNLSLKQPTPGAPFWCAYVVKYSGRHILSKKSNLILIDVVVGVGWVRMLVVGGSFFTINGLIFLIFQCFF